jgi:hypothetical protein
MSADAPAAIRKAGCIARELDVPGTLIAKPTAT